MRYFIIILASVIVALSFYDTVADRFRAKETPASLHCRYLDLMLSGFIVDEDLKPSHLYLSGTTCTDPRTGLEVTEQSIPY